MDLTNKMHQLVREERPLKERLLFSLLPTFAFVFTFILFGILDLTLANRDMLPFGFMDVVLPVILLGGAVWILLVGFSLLFRGKLYDYFLSLLAGILLAGYLQGNFLNLSLGELTGDAINWSRYYPYAVFNLFVWLLILILPFFILYFSRTVWKKGLVILSGMLIAMQGVALISSLLTSDLSTRSSEKYLSDKGIFELSDDENVIVFLVDRLDSEYVETVKEDDPDFFDTLDGFTYFPDHTSMYCRTYPSVAYMLTGALSHYETPGPDFLTEAWKNSAFISALKKQGYATNLYLPLNYAYSDVSQLDGLADNIADGKTRFDTFAILGNMMQFSSYRYAPHLFKENLWFSPTIFNDVVVSDEYRLYAPDDVLFYADLTAQGLHTQNKHNSFFFYHLNGCHDLLLDENAQLTASPTIVSQTKGIFKIIKDYIQQMKDLGIYDDATIIITGDHGFSADFSVPNKPMRTGLFVKQSGISGTPLAISEAPVSHDNFQGTIADAAGIPNEPFGPSVFEVPVDADITRRFLFRRDETDYSSSYLEEYEIRGDSRDFANWHKIGQEDIAYLY